MLGYKTMLKKISYTILLILFSLVAFCQQDIDFHVSLHLLNGKNIIKVKRDFNDPYLWVLAKNNEIFRVNSLDNSVTDYTTAFSSFSTQTFIDIAGRSKDTVFVATNTTNLIVCKIGVISVLGTAQGIAGNINSIGVDNVGSVNGFIPTNSILIIATANGFNKFDYKTGTVAPATFNSPTSVFEASYRTEILHDPSNCRCYYTSPIPYSITQLLKYTIYSGEVYSGNQFGNTIKTAYNTKGSAYSNNLFVVFANQFWGTENGLFQNYWDFSYDPTRGYKTYFTGQSINKITSIYGLLSFGSDYNYGGAHENLLIGTDDGLYFSDSHYQFSGGVSPTYNFTYFNNLSHLIIHDICVNATSNKDGACEDGVWLATSDGLFEIKPDYSRYLATDPKTSAIQFKNQQPQVSDLQICTGGLATATINQFVYTGHSIQWYKNGVELIGQSNNELTITDEGAYSALVYDSCDPNIHMSSNILKVSVLQSPTVNLPYLNKNYYCDGDAITYSTNADPNYKYRWYKDGILINNAISDKLTITESGKYKVEASACLGSWFPSNEIEAVFTKIPLPVITADKIQYCEGTPALLSANVPLNSSYNINWFSNGVLMTNNTNKTTITTVLPGSYSVSVNSTLGNCDQSSANMVLNFITAPSISIQKLNTSTLCDGQSAKLKATVSSGNILWSTGESSAEITVNKSGVYTATVTTVSGCSAAATSSVNFLPNPVLHLSDTTLCQFENQQITLSAPPNFKTYVWNGINGGPQFVTSALGTVKLTVTDENGCTASQVINISSRCKEIHMGNTFTPNGDNINDNWAITGLENDPTVTVKVFNRNGSLVYYSKKYNIPWDGTKDGNKLPAGVYYYVISSKQGTQILSGSLSIIY